MPMWIRSSFNTRLSRKSSCWKKIEAGDKAGSQQILNEILGHIFFSSSGSLEVTRARVIELVVLLSRAAIRAAPMSNRFSA